jgi:hypothetical protein
LAAGRPVIFVNELTQLLMTLTPYEETAMNAKLIAVAFVALAFVSGARAEQPHGRSSVYAAKSTPSKQTASDAKVTRQGRDSVFVTNSPAPKASVKVGNTTFKYGRA